MHVSQTILAIELEQRGAEHRPPHTSTAGCPTEATSHGRSTQVP